MPCGPSACAQPARRSSPAHCSTTPSVAPPARRLHADFGVEEAVKVEGLSKADIAKQLEALVKKGETMPRSAESEGKL